MNPMPQDGVIPVMPALDGYPEVLLWASTISLLVMLGLMLWSLRQG